MVTIPDGSTPVVDSNLGYSLAVPRGWTYVEPATVIAKSGVQDVAAAKQFVFHLGASRPTYAPWLWRDLEQAPESGAQASSCAHQVCCEVGIDCEQQVFLPLVTGRP